MATNYKKYILSTGTHYISNSGSDENGATHGGKAGDQNGKEWRLRSWYSRPWTSVLRWPDINVGTLLAQLGIDAALNDKIGYDQYQRDTFWKEVRKVGYLPKNVAVACEEDCTAGVNGLVHCAGYLLGIEALKAIPETGIRSGNMRATYKKAGFKVLTDSKYLNGTAYLLPGDILLYDNHHAATNVTAGKHTDYTYRDVIDDLPAYQGGKKIEGLRRGDMGDDVRAMQRALLLWNPECLPKYGADGDFGGETEDALKAFQRSADLPETGVYDAATKKALTAIGAPKRVIVSGGNVNVRSAPGTDSRILGVVHAGDTLPYQDVTKTHDGRDWYLVAYEGENGWVSSKYSRIEG